MNIKKSIVLLFVGIFMALQNAANATKLPDEVWDFVKSNLPKAQQRFDSVITLSDNIMYIPLYPPAEKEVSKISIEYVYPQNKTLKDLPEVVLLNNGYSLLKVFKDEKGHYSLTKKDDLPIKVRLGLMPQDMLTPVGLKMPESLKLTLGDLLIPSREETSLVLKDEDKAKTKNPYSPTVKRNEFIPTVEFKDKKTLINPKSSKFLEVYDSTSQNPLYELKLNAMPLKIVMSEKSKAAIILYWNNKNVEIIDLKDEGILGTIELDANATDVVLNKKENVAYVTSQRANSIYIISLNTMQLEKIVKLDQKPSKITYCELDDSITFFDEFSSKVYNVTRNGADYVVQPMGSVNNVSKILSDVANIYAISRTQNELYVFDKTQGKLLRTIEIDQKPTDAIIYGTKLFILCAKEGYMDIFDTVEGKLTSREQLSKDGFYSKMTLIPNDNSILITGMNSKNYLVYSLDKMKLVRKQESYIDVANIIILDKAQRL